jgi:hypothetical protein
VSIQLAESPTMQMLSTPTARIAFPAKTADTPWTFTVTGTDADGNPFTDSADSDSNSIQVDLPVGGTYTLIVSKNGISSLASAPFTVGDTRVTLTVPDATQPASIADAT